jgi:hypothetical protein
MSTRFTVHSTMFEGKLLALKYDWPYTSGPMDGKVSFVLQDTENWQVGYRKHEGCIQASTGS